MARRVHAIDAEVDWNIELGTVARLAQGPGTGPALLFNKIRDYGENARCRQVFAGALSSYRRIAMMLGLPPDTHPRELVKLGRTVLTGAIPPKIVKTGPVKENIVKGDDVDLPTSRRRNGTAPTAAATFLLMAASSPRIRTPTS